MRILINYIDPPEWEWVKEDQISALNYIYSFVELVEDYIHEAQIKDVIINISYLDLNPMTFMFILDNNELTKKIFKK